MDLQYQRIPQRDLSEMTLKECMCFFIFVLVLLYLAIEYDISY